MRITFDGFLSAFIRATKPDRKPSCLRALSAAMYVARRRWRRPSPRLRLPLDLRKLSCARGARPASEATSRRSTWPASGRCARISVVATGPMPGMARRRRASSASARWRAMCSAMALSMRARRRARLASSARMSRATRGRSGSARNSPASPWPSCRCWCRANPELTGSYPWLPAAKRPRRAGRPRPPPRPHRQGHRRAPSPATWRSPRTRASCAPSPALGPVQPQPRNVCRGRPRRSPRSAAARGPRAPRARNGKAKGRRSLGDGRRHLRRAMYMAALSTLRHDGFLSRLRRANEGGQEAVEGDPRRGGGPACSSWPRTISSRPGIPLRAPSRSPQLPRAAASRPPHQGRSLRGRVPGAGRAPATVVWCIYTVYTPDRTALFQ